MTDPTSGITVANVNHRYRSGQTEVIALQNIAVDIAPGEFVCLLGPSGCGKSTLLNIVGGFITPTEGEVRCQNRKIDSPGPDRGMVFQEYALFPWMTVAQNIDFGLRIQKISPQQRADRIQMLLSLFGLSDFAERYPKDLSGGMKQRVAIARLLALDSPILLMDEPFGALDALTRRSLQDELLQVWQLSKKTVVFVTHSIEESLFLADRILIMTYRPGTIKKDIRIDLSRPRDPAAPEFNRIRKEISELVMAEQHRHERAEGKKIPAVD